VDDNCGSGLVTACHELIVMARYCLYKLWSVSHVAEFDRRGKPSCGNNIW
jgi:hypothetical protein